MKSGPREALLSQGASVLSDEELVAVLLGTGRRGEPVTVLAARVIATVGGLGGLTSVVARQLGKLPGIGPTKATRLVAAVELGRRMAARPLDLTAELSSSRDVYATFGPRLESMPVETFVVVTVDSKNRLLGLREVARGGPVSCQVDVAQVFRAVLSELGSGALFIHNHPSGDPTPSADDAALTHRLLNAGGLLGVRVLDHIIIGKGSYFSFRDEGRLLG